MGTRTKKDKRVAKLPTGEIVGYDYIEYRVDILPPPDELERYEKMNSGTAKAIMDSYIAQVNHRMSLEAAVIQADNRRANRGQIISAFLAFLCIISGGILTYLGKDAVGLSLIIGSIGTLLTAFYGGAIIRKIERIKKEKGQ
ncbi:MAG: DUF2335 domain-containing protein [Treponema sp.]|nr:DUF2335 domain-containing protein [Treponema sp.]